MDQHPNRPTPDIATPLERELELLRKLEENIRTQATRVAGESMAVLVELSNLRRSRTAADPVPHARNELVASLSRAVQGVDNSTGLADRSWDVVHRLDDYLRALSDDGAFVRTPLRSRP